MNNNNDFKILKKIKINKKNNDCIINSIDYSINNGIYNNCCYLTFLIMFN